MSFRDASKRVLEPRLVCPFCTAMNRPGATVIEIMDDFRTALCGVCSRSAPIKAFQPEREAQA